MQPVVTSRTTRRYQQSSLTVLECFLQLTVKIFVLHPHCCLQHVCLMDTLFKQSCTYQSADGFVVFITVSWKAQFVYYYCIFVFCRSHLNIGCLPRSWPTVMWMIPCLVWAKFINKNCMIADIREPILCLGFYCNCIHASLKSDTRFIPNVWI